MRRLLIIVFFLFLSHQIQSQQLYKMSMSVFEVQYDQTYYISDTTVIWGANKDTLCFAFTSNIKCYYPVSQNTLGKKANKKIKRRLNGHKYFKPNHYTSTFILQDRFNEIYSISFVKDKRQGTIAIFISNVVYGTPSYVLCSHYNR